jgi:hypothetical protein
VVVGCGDDLADKALALVRSVQGEQSPDGLSRLDLANRVLGAVSVWWQATDPTIMGDTNE